MYSRLVYYTGNKNINTFLYLRFRGEWMIWLIDFKMMKLFFLCLETLFIVETMIWLSTLREISGKKLYPVGTFEGSKWKF